MLATLVLLALPNVILKHGSGLGLGYSACTFLPVHIRTLQLFNSSIMSQTTLLSFYSKWTEPLPPPCPRVIFPPLPKKWLVGRPKKVQTAAWFHGPRTAARHFGIHHKNAQQCNPHMSRIAIIVLTFSKFHFYINHVPLSQVHPGVGPISHIQQWKWNGRRPIQSTIPIMASTKMMPQESKEVFALSKWSHLEAIWVDQHEIDPLSIADFILSRALITEFTQNRRAEVVNCPRTV